MDVAKVRREAPSLMHSEHTVRVSENSFYH